jgi:hypothetical protein
MRSRSDQSARTVRKPAHTVLFGLVGAIAERLDRRFGWDHLPLPVGVMTLFGLRYRLRRRNLYPVNAGLPPPSADALGEARLSANTSSRTRDGRFNDFEDPEMGAACTRFGRNSPAVPDKGLPGDPSPQEVSEKLLARHVFLPATGLNLLAAAWVQFEVHDWFSHLIDAKGKWDVGGHKVGRLWRDPRADIPTFVSGETHWWDGSQLYGTDAQFAANVRADGGRLKIDNELLEAIEEFATRKDNVACGSLAKAIEDFATRKDDVACGCPASPRGVANLWVGLALFHVLFAREHNAICDRLRSAHPGWDDDRLFATARLINTALMAKIHTVEWTPAMIAHPTTQYAIRATWWGLLGERFRKACGRIGQGEILSGIPGSATDHDGVPYSLTEEFVAVYRMHPLLPDEVTFHSAGDERVVRGPLKFGELAMAHGNPAQPREVLHKIGYANAFYSLGIANPGAITLHNYPEFLRDLTRVNDDKLDVAAVDVLRTRECAVARYNDFRRLFRLRPASSFYDLAGNDELAREIRKVYRGNLEAVDLMVGLFAERKPAGFAFGDTAFRVFLLMAARRLASDRFFTADFTPEVYTPAGLEWIDETTLAGMLRRHYPELGRVLRVVDNPFLPWGPVPG